VHFAAASTTTGTFTITDLPVGIYTVTVTVTGFKTYSHSNLGVPATQTVREDIALQVGTSSESVTVTAEGSLLTTESGELATNVTIDQLDGLPLLGIGTVNAGTSGYRNPYNTLLTLPGVSSYASSGQFNINGLTGALTETMRVEGQDATSRLFGTFDYTQMAQPGADSIQEIAYQTSNYAPEFGQAGSVVINMIMKSGTNKYHGSGYDYFVNEDLNAGDPFSVNTSGVGKVRPRNRRNDFGGTLGGPIYVPKVYNGHNKSFFFFSYEQFLESTLYSDTDTVPSPAYLAGNFGAISPNGTCSLCQSLGIQTTALGVPNIQKDALGNPLFANEIYDPATRGTVNGLGYATPFPNNTIPVSRFDPVTVNFLNLFQKLGVVSENQNLLSNNYKGTILGGRYSAIPAVKIDHNIDSKDKLSFYYSENNTQSQISGPLGNQDGLPTEIGQYRGTFIPTYTERLNYDRTLSPTLLLHLGAGYLHTSFSDRAPFLNFDPAQFGLSGFLNGRQFPSITGLCTPISFANPACNSLGGMQTIGTSGQIQSLNFEEKPSMNANMTWVHGKHTYKAGAELYFEQDYTGSFSGVTLATGIGPTSQPFQPTNSLNAYTTGFGFASFLLGDYSATTQTPQENTREGSAELAIFVQDSWKVTRKLTVDYGIRWDLATPEHEQFGRLGQLDETLANANAGGHPGALQYANTCKCSFYPGSYPYALGPRIGIAYQIDPKTVLRAGWGVTYQFVANPAGAVYGTQGIFALAPQPNNAQYVNDQTPGFIARPIFPVTNPNLFPVAPGTLGAPGSFFQAATEPYVADPQQNRPPRVNQYSVSIQREITPNLVVEAAYVGNHAVWISGPYGFLSQTSAARYAQFGLYPYAGTGPAGYNNYADYLLLSQPLSNPLVTQSLAARGIANILPYSDFPLSGTLQDALYPFPQFPGLEPSVSPTGDSHYDSLQVKATKRLSHNLQAGGTFTWAKGFASPTVGTQQDFFNPASEQQVLQNIPPRTLNFQFLYTTPSVHNVNKYLNLLTKDWQLGGFANYQSGRFLTPPTSPNLNFLPSEDIRVAGQPLYTQGVNPNNLSSYNPYFTQVLNPNAWAPCPVNQTCAAMGVLNSAFRAPRTPTENANLGRNFKVRERMNLSVRAEFVNIFNRTLLPPPVTTGGGVGPQIPASKNALGIYTGGFGTIDVYNAPGTFYAAPAQATGAYLSPRSGTLIARFTF
jgi:hypothetical protein